MKVIVEKPEVYYSKFRCRLYVKLDDGRYTTMEVVCPTPVENWAAISDIKGKGRIVSHES